MQLRTSFPFLLLLFVLLAGCQKKKEDSGLDLSGQYYADASGIVTRVSAFDDYIPGSWQHWVPALFTPLDAERLPLTTRDSVQLYTAYPNPCRPVQQLAFRSFDSVSLGIVVVDRQKNVLLRSSFIRPPGKQVVSLDYTALANRSDSLFRCYVGFSSAGHRYFLKSHFDFTIGH